MGNFQAVKLGGGRAFPLLRWMGGEGVGFTRYPQGKEAPGGRAEHQAAGGKGLWLRLGACRRRGEEGWEEPDLFFWGGW